ncbi:hypothetical protein ACE8EZ_07785 [Pantoea deleyi]|uniref:hypothetical protein n=1 Tax=Pantoea deleyi TaxID=470932 RepID=UPI0035D40BC4
MTGHTLFKMLRDTGLATRSHKAGGESIAAAPLSGYPETMHLQAIEIRERIERERL